MLHVLDALTASRLVELLFYKPVKGLEIEICKPWRGVIANRARDRRRVYDLVKRTQGPLVFDLATQHFLQLVRFDIFEKTS